MGSPADTSWTTGNHAWVRVRWAAGVLALLTLAWAPGLHAQPAPDSSESEASPSDEAVVRAREAYAGAVKAYEQRRYKDAIDWFIRADQLSPNPAFSFNIGIAYEDMGDAALALRYYRAYVRQVPDAADRDDVDRRIERLEGELQKKGVQQVTVLSTPSGATVAIDGDPVGVTPWTGEIPPGHHKVTLHLRGYADEPRAFDLPPSRAIDVPVTMTATGDQGASTGTQENAARAERGGFDVAWYQRISPLSLIVTGAGAVSLGIAGGFELARSDAEQSATAEPVQLEAQTHLEKARSRETMAVAFAVAGGALLVTGGVLTYLDLTAPSKQAPVTGACTPLGCALQYSGSF